MALTYSQSPYIFGAAIELDEKLRDGLISLFEQAPGTTGRILGGRVEPVRGDIPDIGPVIVKHYRRGGLVRHFIKDRYVGWGTPRPRREFEMLERVRSIGVSSPQPVAWAIRGRSLYRGFLVTRMIEGVRSLTEVGKEDAILGQSAIAKAAVNINLLLKHRIYHVDLHPGNVLVDRSGEVFIIDFDKARSVSWRLEKLRTEYIHRWKRAVEKYSLPVFMVDLMAEGLGVSG